MSRHHRSVIAASTPWVGLAILMGSGAILFGSVQVAGAQDSNPLLKGTPHPNRVEAPESEQIDESITRGVDFLLSDQNANGSWGSATRTKGLNIYAPIPGAHHAFRAAVTSLCISALIRSGDERPSVIVAVQRAEDWLVENLERVRRAEPEALYNVWAHAYSIEALVDLYHLRSHDSDRQVKFQRLIAMQVDRLRRYESVDGGWGYYDFRASTQRPTSNPNSFTTATALVALHRARAIGVEVSQKMVQRALDCVHRQQKPDFTYLYADHGPVFKSPMRSINRPGGSLGRSQACNFALRLWGDPRITDKVINVWLDRLFARNLWLDIGRKRPIPHESHFLVAGYFYYYGHWYAARSFAMLPPDERPRHQAQMARLLIDRQEQIDGSWWDYPLYDYHQPYGTAMAIMSLVDCR